MPSLLKITRYSIPLIVFGLLLLFFWRGLGKDPSKIPSALLGKPVPHFSQNDLDLSAPDISEKLFKGHISLLTVWATWCAVCQKEHETLMNISHKSGIRLYGLNYKDSRPAALDWLSKMGNPFVACIYDPEGQLAMQLGVYGTPETFLIDSKGMIRYKHLGPVSDVVWNYTLMPLIEKIRVEK